MATITTAISAERRVRRMKDGIHGSCAAQGWNCPNQRKKQTNADRIRSMSDEELADFIEMKQFFALANNGTDGEEYTLKWLQSEVEE